MTIDLVVEDAAPAALAPFGRLVAAGLGAIRTSVYYGDAVELHDTPDFRSDADTRLSVARVHPRAPQVEYLERHFKHTQAFLPLNGAPYVVVMAPPGGDVQPDPAAVRAFRFRGDQGFLMHIGTWHEFPFALATPVELVVVLRNETNRDLDAVADGEAVGADLEKRNVARRFDARIRYTPPPG